jgi:hypothetical protein
MTWSIRIEHRRRHHRCKQTIKPSAAKAEKRIT